MPHLHRLLFLTLLLFSQHSWANSTPTVLGQTGLINMPDARIGEEGLLRMGYSFYKPYPTFWSSVSLFPRFEVSARYTRFMYVTAFEGQGFGGFKDKAFDAKLLLLQESKYLPAVSIGTHDFLGTQLLNANYITLNKRFGPLDFSLGYGQQRLKKWFGGLRYTPDWHKNLRLVAEYDAFDYENDPHAQQSKATEKPGGATFGLEYHYGWLGSQLSYQDGDWAVNGFLSIPLQQKEFIPKINEPKPYTQNIQRVRIHQWQADKQYAAQLVTALEIQGYKNVKIRLNKQDLELSFSQTRIRFVGRAIGRAVRTALLMSPLDAKSIKLSYYTLSDLPVVTYHFQDLDQLDRFFSGKVTYGELLKNLNVSYSEPDYINQFQANVLDLRGYGRGDYAKDIGTDDEKKHEKNDSNKPGQVQPKAAVGEIGEDDDADNGFQLSRNEGGHSISLLKQDKKLSHYQIVPFNFGLFFNDPSGALRYDTFSKAFLKQQLGRGLFLEGALRLQLFENVSGVTQESNSTLPHVRTDVADYKRERGLKLSSLMLNKYFQLYPRVYARLSAGIYEEMFGGAGGQILYLPKQGSWATDLTVDWLRQRDPEGDFGFRDYETVTALWALHYQIKKYGVTATLRGGRFLAKDSGMRLELTRRFRSGIKVGFWYTVTDGNDTTGPGKPNDPYYDKGIMMSIPFGSMLPKDTRAKAGFALAPWTRDVGQTVKSPGDLYQIMEDPLLLDHPEHHLLTDFHY